MKCTRMRSFYEKLKLQIALLPIEIIKVHRGNIAHRCRLVRVLSLKLLKSVK